MFARRAIQFTTKGRRNAIFGATIVALLSIPLILTAFDPPPPGESGAVSGETCGTGSCHHHGTTTTSGGFTLTSNGSPLSTYTPGVAMTLTLTATAGAPAFELTATSGNFTVGSNTQTQADTAGGTSGMDIENNGGSGPWTFMWTPPSSGTVTMNLAGATGQTIWANAFTLTPGGGGGTPTLTVTPSPLSFTATAGSTTALSQNVSVAASDGTAQTFSAAATVTTPSGGTWLSVGSAMGTTPTTTFAVSANPTGLAAGSYSGNVTFTSSGVSNSPVTLPVTLTVNAAGGGGGTTGATFSLIVVDRQSGGGDWLLLDGSGSVSSSNTATGNGFFTRFRGRSGESDDGGSATGATVVADGTWKATSVTSSTSGNVVLQVQLTSTAPGSSSLSTGTLTITNNGATLAINGGDTFNPVGIGTVSITGATGGGGGGGGDDHGGHDN